MRHLVVPQVDHSFENLAAGSLMRRGTFGGRGTGGGFLPLNLLDFLSDALGTRTLIAALPSHSPRGMSHFDAHVKHPSSLSARVTVGHRSVCAVAFPYLVSCRAGGAVVRWYQHLGQHAAHGSALGNALEPGGRKGLAAVLWAGAAAPRDRHPAGVCMYVESEGGSASRGRSKAHLPGGAISQ